MRRLKLQVQISVDGFVAGPNGALDWMTWDWDDELKSYVEELTDSVDTILLGRKMTDGFISHWSKVAADPNHPEHASAKKFVDIPKVVFTKTLSKSSWKNTTLAKGDLLEEVNKLKRQDGKGIIVYGGAGFVSSLIQHNLIDDYHLFINPAAIGKGMAIFNKVKDQFNLKLLKSNAFSCGIVVNHYEPN